jgi:hypothetical protein
MGERDPNRADAPMAAADVPADLTGRQDALVNTENVEQFRPEMAVLPAQAVGSDSSCAMTMGHGPRPVRSPALTRWPRQWMRSNMNSTPARACTPCGLVKWSISRTPRERRTGPGSSGGPPPWASSRAWPATAAAVEGLADRGPQPLRAARQGLRRGRSAARQGFRRERLRGAGSRHPAGLARRLIDQLRSSMASRTVIDQALGIIMTREQCTQARAFDILCSSSQHRNVKLRDIADAIITSISGEPPQPAPVFEADLYRVAVNAGNRVSGPSAC